MHKSGLIELEAVLAVARCRGFRAAATALGMSTTAVSNAVAGLEARLGVRLFNRTTRSVALTEAGEQFVARVAPAMVEIHGAIEGINEHRQTPKGTLRLNASAGAARMVFSRVIAEYLRRYPEMKVEIVTEGRMIDVVGEDYDAGIRLSEMVPRDMVRVPVGAKLRMAVVGSPGYFSEFPIPVSPADLAAHRCVRTRFPSGAASPWEFARRGETISVDVPGVLTLDEPNLIYDAARVGAGLAYLGEWYVAEDIEAGRLIRVLDDWTPSLPGLALYYAQGRHMAASLRALVDLVHELSGQHHR